MIAELQTGKLNGDPVWSLPIEALSTSENGWPPRPFQIVSLLQVVETEAYAFYIISNLIGTAILSASEFEPEDKIEGDEIKLPLSTLEDIRSLCEHADLKLSKIYIDGMVKSTAKGDLTF